MNAPASTAPDVLAVLDQAAAREVLEMRAPLIEARAAVAELIEADREYDEARADWRNLTRLNVAKARRAAALVRVGGGK